MRLKCIAETVGFAQLQYRGRFETNGSEDPPDTSGQGISVSREETGVYKVQLLSEYGDLLCATGAVKSAGAEDLFVQFGEYDDEEGTLEVRLVDGTGSVVSADPSGPEVMLDILVHRYRGVTV